MCVLRLHCKARPPVFSTPNSLQVMQPDPAVAPAPRLPPPAAAPRVGLLLRQRLPDPGAELEVVRNNPPGDPRVSGRV